MSKEELRNYQAIQRELTHLEAFLRKVERYEIEELRVEYAKKCADLANRLLKIEKAIETLGPTERTLMRLRYIDGLQWQAICMRINYSWQQTHRIHKNALIKLKDF